MAVVLTTLMVILYLSNHYSIVLRANCNFLARQKKFLETEDIAISSANNASLIGGFFEMSAVNRLYSTEPTIDPCGIE